LKWKENTIIVEYCIKTRVTIRIDSRQPSLESGWNQKKKVEATRLLVEKGCEWLSTTFIF
jgi:hypothetical protein